MTNKLYKYKYIYIVFALVLFVVSVMGGRYIPSAFADTPKYTSALTDLQKDSEFTPADYPDNASDYSIQFIQIAESADKELFVYTYQPSQKTTYLVATEINMALSESVDDTQLYGLTLLNSDGVFCKYKVNDFIVSGEAIRYYNITSIYRKWQKGIDKETGNDNTKNAVAFNVGKLYIATAANGNIEYICKCVDTIEIINPYADHLEYSNGFKLYGSWCDSHYVAFSTDKQIDTLMEADVSFSYVRIDRDKGHGKDYPDESTRDSRIHKLNGTQKGGNAADGWLAKKYEWERIQSVDEFVRTESLTDNAKSNLDGKQWVLRFCETERKQYWGNADRKPDIHGSILWQVRTDVYDVTILRLKFETDGVVYDLGAVSDKVTGDNVAGNTNTNEHAGLWEWLSRVTGIPEWVWKLILVAIVFAICLPILSAIFPVVGQVLLVVFKAIGTAFVWALKGVWWLICLPFKGIAAIVQKIKDKKDGC